MVGSIILQTFPIPPHYQCSTNEDIIVENYTMQHNLQKGFKQWHLHHTLGAFKYLNWNLLENKAYPNFIMF